MEIKFRLYDHKNKRQIYNPEELALDFNGEVLELSYFAVASKVDMSRYTLEQYVGVRDENGAFIYAGDIVKREYPEEKKKVTEGDIEAEDLSDEYYAVMLGETIYFKGYRAYLYTDEFIGTGRYPEVADFEKGCKYTVVGNVHEGIYK